MKKCLFLLCTLFLQGLISAELLPWIGSLELRSKAGFLVERYTKIPSKHTIHEDNTGLLYFVGLGGTYENWALEVELFIADTKHRSLGFSHARETLRYQLLDDIIGDDVSLTFGFSASEVTTKTLKDVTFIHHGHFEGFFFLSLGKELSLSWTRWCTRAFGTLALGVADQGSPWINGAAYYEWASECGHIIGAGGSFEAGFGTKNVHLHHFDGYGNIKYRTLNLEGYYSYAFDKAHFLKAGVDIALVAKNCPQAVSFSLMYLVIFGP